MSNNTNTKYTETKNTNSEVKTAEFSFNNEPISEIDTAIAKSKSKPSTFKTVLTLAIMIIASALLAVIEMDVWCVLNMVGEHSFYAVCAVNGWLANYFFIGFLLLALNFVVIDVMYNLITEYVNRRKKK